MSRVDHAATAPLERFTRLDHREVVAIAKCVRRFANCETFEDIELLPMLLRITKGSPGTFFEIGASTGMDGSNTLVLEKCFGWNGILGEAQPSTFAKLQQAPRLATKVWAAACPAGQTVQFFNFSSQTSAVVEASWTDRTRITLRKEARRHGASARNLVTVPCRPLSQMVLDAGYVQMDFLALDVQGAELTALQTIDPRRFRSMLVEAEGCDASSMERNAAVGKHISDAGFQRRSLLLPHMGLDGRVLVGAPGYNKLYARPELPDGRPSQARTPKHLGRLSLRSYMLNESQRSCESRIEEALRSVGFAPDAIAQAVRRTDAPSANKPGARQPRSCT